MDKYIPVTLQMTTSKRRVELRIEDLVQGNYFKLGGRRIPEACGNMYGSTCQILTYQPLKLLC